ncbi:ATP-binding protein [Tumebacillus sp. DT12]|uniref:histidine kinase n=1 Tax=Tumebacillus lacus TaxID=2995335 RepID=A0ABT3WZV9_9BACL|nr:ATP-binding protein [Tumebacillus lacus]MCX7569062.1 ATP-binding protein [Tumebacillus lacus]
MKIRNSIVAKLLLTIIGLFIVVLVLLSIFLEQLFDSYFYKAEAERLQHRIEHMVDVIQNYPEPLNQTIVEELAKEEAGMPKVIPPWMADDVIAQLSPAQLEQIVQGRGVVVQGKQPSWDTEVPTGTSYIWALQPLVVGGQIDRLLYVIQPTTAADAIDRVRELLFFAAGLAIMLATGLAFVVSMNLSRPLVQMNKVAEQMAQGDFHGKVEVVTRDEVGRLGLTLNTLAYKLEENIDDLEREKEQLASIITSMTDGVVAADLNGTVTLANPPARRYMRAKLLTDTGSPNDRELPRELYELEMQVMRSGQQMNDEFDWQGRILVVTMVPLYEKDGASQRGVVAVLRDITHERTLDKMRQDFIANVSHELRTPLAMMQGYSEALLDEFGDDPEQRQELTQIILDETHRMRRLVNDLLDLAQLESGQFQMNDEEVNMVHLIKRIGRKFATVAHEREVHVVVEVDVPEESEPMLVQGDTDRLEQVFTNLVDNAFRHTAKGGQITMQLTRTEGLVRVGVRDTGEGIPQEDLPFIWDRFYKVDKARTRSKGGTGLGLAITRNIVKNHHGDIVVESEVGTGTQFNVLLPILHA